jgi:riboflavin kinase/FMN adenylyltransferase
MQIIRGNAITDKKTAVALGNFDGLHIAHTQIINNMCRYAKEHDCIGCVLLFNGHTRRITNNEDTKLITTECEKLKLLSEMGVNSVYIREFDRELMQLSPRDFVKMLVTKINPEAVCVGYDYRFGYKAEGDTELLRTLGREFGFSVIVTEEIKQNQHTVKSTKIREFISDGDIKSANAMLGRPYFIMGEVEKGLQNGQKIGIPTANIGYAPDKLLPENGVYMGYTIIGDDMCKSVINIGNNPTFGADKITVESHILDFDSDIYGKIVTVELVDRIRDEITFSSLDELKTQINSDINSARQALK